MMKIYLPIFLCIIFFGCCVNSIAQNITITTEDMKIFRQAQLDAVTYKDEAEFWKAKSKKWEESAGKWEKQAINEKNRADGVLEKAVKECDDSKAELGKANFFLRQQSDDDRQKIGELQFDVRKLKSERKWWFAAGFGAGSAAGGAAGYQVGKRFRF